MVNEYLLLLGGFVFLMGGAELFVRGASRIALALGVSTLLIGLTVVGFGTSSAELFVCARAALGGTTDLAVGNIVGSNIFNILVIVGLSALLAPVKLARSVIVREVPVMLTVMALFFLCSLNNMISRAEGAVFFILIIVYVLVTYKLEKGKGDGEEFHGDKKRALLIGGGFSLAGLLLMVIGSGWIVDNAVIIAERYNVSQMVIGVTLVAVGTSLPELATTIIACIKKKPDLIVGGAIGSNIFNVLCVIGATSLISPLKIPESALKFDYPYMLLACAVVWPMMSWGKSLNRLEGVLMLLVYSSYIYFTFV